ncbi:MAG TPA: hypothetical protein VGK38_09805 [Prolixibacteraceae bacterium]
MSGFDYDLMPGFPNTPTDEISRDGINSIIEKKLTESSPARILVGDIQSGKTNLLAQFCRRNEGRVISYFINSNPWTQRQHSFLFSICSQINSILEKPDLPQNIDMATLQALLVPLSTLIAKKAKAERQTHYFVIDGIEYSLEGVQGERIIDLLPLHTFPKSPYLLLACRGDFIGRLPETIKLIPQVDIYPFNEGETRSFFADTDIPLQTINLLQRNSQGNPGILRAYKEHYLSGEGKNGFTKDVLDQPIEKLIGGHVETVIASAESTTIEALKLLTVAPVPLHINDVASIIGLNPDDLLEAIRSIGFVDHKNSLLEINKSIAKEYLKKKFAQNYSSLIKILLEYFKSKRDTDDFTMTYLLREAHDYEGMVAMVTKDAIINTVNSTMDITGVVKRLRIANEMARDKRDIGGLLNITLGTAISRIVFEHAVNLEEIDALLAIGETKEALKKVYAVPDLVSRIRLLARAYTSFKRKGDIIPIQAVDELKDLVGRVYVDSLDKELIQDLAVDLFPILHDESVTLLDRVIGDHNNLTLVETALKTINSGISEVDFSLLNLVNDPKHRFITTIYSPWLSNLSFERLRQEISGIQRTSAKEFVIRQWCNQNCASEDLEKAVLLWLEIVISDTGFVIPIRSLRTVSEILQSIPFQKQDVIITKLEIPGLTVLDSPKEEWVRYKLNIADVFANMDHVLGLERISAVIENVNASMVDIDVRVYCLARIWSSLIRNPRTPVEMLASIKGEFEKNLDALLSESAYQLDLLIKTIKELINVDLDYALKVADRLNLHSRRIMAYSSLMNTALREKNNQDLSCFINSIVSRLEKSERDRIINRAVAYLADKNISLNNTSLEILIRYSRDSSDPSLKADSIIYSGLLLYPTDKVNAIELIKEGMQVWEQEEDLKLRFSLGYKIVSLTSNVDKELAKQFCEKVEGLYNQSGACLASGDLGVVYAKIIILILRSLTINDLTPSEKFCYAIEALIDNIPSKVNRIALFAELAASSIRVGYPTYAFEIIRKKVLPDISKLESVLDQQRTIAFALPVIYEYDQGTAEELAGNLPFSARNQAWYKVIAWSLNMKLLSDTFEDKDYRIKNDYTRINNYALGALNNIDEDLELYSCIIIICKVIEASLGHRLDITQALDIIDKLDKVVQTKLPDPRNITHHGYLYISTAQLYETKSNIYRKSSKSKRISKHEHQELRKLWIGLINQVETLNNLADLVFVKGYIALNVNGFDDRLARELLEQATKEVLSITNLLDREDRLGIIAKSWHQIGEDDKAKNAIEQATDIVCNMEDVDYDELVKVLVQAAYKISPDYADELISKLDSRLPNIPINAGKIEVQTQKLIGSPSKVSTEETIEDINNSILQSSSMSLLHSLLAQKGNIPDQAVLEKWLFVGSQHSAHTVLNILEWVIEATRLRYSSGVNNPFIVGLIDSAILTYELAKWISPNRRKGIPESIQGIYPGLSSKIIIFKEHETERAYKWITEWIQNNVKEYLKVCDPYFGLDDLEMLSCLPEGCKVLIVTTDNYIDVNNCEELKKQITHQWDEISFRKIPSIILLVVPKTLDHKFHDRAIVTKGAGLDIGQSLNGIGRSFGKITILSEEDAQDLEKKYVDGMLNQPNWFMENGVYPVFISIGGGIN